MTPCSPGLNFAYAINSLTDFTGSDGFTAKTRAFRMRPANVKRKLVTLAALELVRDSNVYPSGDALTTACTAMLVPAPGRFSMIIGWPSRSDSHWPINRVMRSADPPGAKPTMMRTGRDG